MKSTQDRLLKYAEFDTAANAASDTIPSSAGQKVFGAYLVEEMKSIGIADARMDDYGYVYGSIAATPGCESAPKIGFLAHLDTVDDVPACKDPRVVKNYDGGDILLNKEENIVMSPSEFPALRGLKGEDLIVTNGLTLLGGDDKAGIAEIMVACETLLSDPSIKHGELKIAFTPDEEIGRGPLHFDIKGFGADFAYTADGGQIGGVNYETFNAAKSDVTITGKSIHPGSAKNQMVNASYIAMEFNAMLPQEQKPEYTEGHEGFYFLHEMESNVEKATMHYMLRDHDEKKIEDKKAMMAKVGDFLNAKYGTGTVKVESADMYPNMLKFIEPKFHLVQAVLDAMKDLGIEPKIEAVRGGTDGSQLSRDGLPCPNFCTGDANAHGRFEFVSITQMDKIAEMILKIITNYAK